MKAKEAFVDDHFELAIDLYSQVISLNPKDPNLFADRAQANIFKEHGWPSSTISNTPPETDSDRAKLIDTLQVEPRPGVLRLMDEAKAAVFCACIILCCRVKKLAVFSAATKSSVILCLENLIGIERFQSLDCFLAGDDVKEKKPDPSIYLTVVKGCSGGEDGKRTVCKDRRQEHK